MTYGLQQETETVTSGLSDVSVEQWIIAAAILAAGIFLGLAARRVVTRLLRSKVDSEFAARVVGRVVGYILVLVAFVYAIGQIGLELGPILALAGVAGLAIAFATQDILENLIAGFFMITRRPFNIGDEVETNDIFGSVQDINLRSTTIRRPDGVMVYIPNADVWKSPIFNRSEEGARRSELAVGVGYDTDLDQAARLLEEAAGSVSGVAADPAPKALVEAFGASSIDFTVMYWHEPSIADERGARDRVARAVKVAFDEAGIDIPFPIRTVHLTRTG